MPATFIYDSTPQDHWQCQESCENQKPDTKGTANTCAYWKSYQKPKDSLKHNMTKTNLMFSLRKCNFEEKNDSIYMTNLQTSYKNQGPIMKVKMSE